MKSKFIFLHILFTFVFGIPRLFAQEILINTQEGEIFILEVDPFESLASLKDKVLSFSEIKDQSILIEIPGSEGIAMNYSVSHQGGYLGHPRSYEAGVDPLQKTDIHYIVTFLANKSLFSIAAAKDDLEAAGTRIDKVHPLRFLETIFCDEALKVGIRNIRGKGWVWNHFIGGLKESLSTEYNIGNVESYIGDFAKNVRIDPNLIVGPISSQNWDSLIDTLIHKIPRNGNQDRYDFHYNRS